MHKRYNENNLVELKDGRTVLILEFIRRRDCPYIVTDGIGQFAVDNKFIIGKSFNRSPYNVLDSFKNLLWEYNKVKEK